MMFRIHIKMRCMTKVPAQQPISYAFDVPRRFDVLYDDDECDGIK